MRRIIKEYAGDKIIADFIGSAREVFEVGQNTLKEVIRTLDKQHKGIYDKIFSDQSDRLHSVRFVKYEPAGRGNFLAAGHYDRGSCAIAIAESAPGLRVRNTRGDLKEIKREENIGIFMPVLTFSEDIGSEDFTPTWHDVIQRSEDCKESGDVFFIKSGHT